MNEQLSLLSLPQPSCGGSCHCFKTWDDHGSGWFLPRERKIGEKDNGIISAAKIMDDPMTREKNSRSEIWRRGFSLNKGPRKVLSRIYFLYPKYFSWSTLLWVDCISKIYQTTPKEIETIAFIGHLNSLFRRGLYQKSRGEPVLLNVDI